MQFIALQQDILIPENRTLATRFQGVTRGIPERVEIRVYPWASPLHALLNYPEFRYLRRGSCPIQ
jgi:hypothetical protein